MRISQQKSPIFLESEHTCSLLLPCNQSNKGVVCKLTKIMQWTFFLTPTQIYFHHTPLNNGRENTLASYIKKKKMPNQSLFSRKRTIIKKCKNISGKLIAKKKWTLMKRNQILNKQRSFKT